MPFESTSEAEYPTLTRIGEDAKAGDVYARLLIAAMRIIARSAEPYPTGYETVLAAIVNDLSHEGES